MRLELGAAEAAEKADPERGMTGLGLGSGDGFRQEQEAADLGFEAVHIQRPGQGHVGAGFVESGLSGGGGGHGHEGSRGAPFDGANCGGQLRNRNPSAAAAGLNLEAVRRDDEQLEGAGAAEPQEFVHAAGAHAMNGGLVIAHIQNGGFDEAGAAAIGVGQQKIDSAHNSQGSHSSGAAISRVRKSQKELRGLLLSCFGAMGAMSEGESAARDLRDLTDSQPGDHCVFGALRSPYQVPQRESSL
jgi:hypothetical protein